MTESVAWLVGYQNAADEVDIVLRRRARCRPRLDRQDRSSWFGAPAASATCGSVRRSAARSTPRLWPRRWRSLRGASRNRFRRRPGCGDHGPFRSGASSRRLHPHQRGNHHRTMAYRCSPRPLTRASSNGKSPRPDGGNPLPLAKEGAQADEAVADAGRKTTSRRDLAVTPGSNRCRRKLVNSTKWPSRRAWSKTRMKQWPCSPT